MVEFKRIVVENYKAIDYAELDFLSGVYKVVGNNLDSTYTSNGSGKTTILQALVLGLYNKDFSGVALESLSNRFTGKPYKIIVQLRAKYLGEMSDITITNPAGVQRMRVEVNGVNVATGAVLCVPLVEKILGMGYTTFKVTHYITSSTIVNLTQNLSQPTLFNDILHIVELQDLDKKLLALSKEISSSLEDIKSKLSTAEEQEKMGELQSRYDKTSLNSSLEIAESTLNALEQKYYNVLINLESQISDTKVSVAELTKAITDTKNSLRNGVCSMCSTLLLDKDTLTSLNSNLEEHQKSLEQQQIILDKYSTQHKVLHSKYSLSKAELQQNISALKQDLNIAVEVDKIKLQTIDISSLRAAHSELEEHSLFIATARKEIKSGKVIKGILEQFFSIVEMKILEYSEIININHFDISIVNDRLGMAIQLKQEGMDVPIDSLSNGERTRLSLLVLISMLDAMKVVSESETNVVVFDEASSSFDKSGVEELSHLFAHLKNLGQACFLITHGSEMDEVPYDYILEITKSTGKSTILVSEV